MRANECIGGPWDGMIKNCPISEMTVLQSPKREMRAAEQHAGPEWIKPQVLGKYTKVTLPVWVWEDLWNTIKEK